MSQRIAVTSGAVGMLRAALSNYPTDAATALPEKALREILEKVAPHLDIQGQPEAIVPGEVVVWINSDEFYRAQVDGPSVKLDPEGGFVHVRTVGVSTRG